MRRPKCLKMNDQVEDARRQLEQFQAQRDAIAGGRRQSPAPGGAYGRARPQRLHRRQADASAGASRQRRRGLFGWFGRGNDEQQPEQPEAPVYRSIDPNGRYRSVCVRTCDGFFFPVSYQTYANRLAQDATVCQSSCAAPAELYVYRNPGQEIDQAISLNGTAYADLPAAFKYRKSYIKGCSCKADEYNPTEIEAANQKAEATPAPGKPGKKKGAAPTAQAAAPAPQPRATRSVTGSTPNAGAPANPSRGPGRRDAAPPGGSGSGAAAVERRQTHTSPGATIASAIRQSCLRAAQARAPGRPAARAA